MMHKFVYIDRRWRKAQNHMDARHCPDCGATVHGRHGQNTHRNHHAAEEEYRERVEHLLTELSKRAGITEEDVELPWTWTAVVEDTEAEVAELEAGDG